MAEIEYPQRWLREHGAVTSPEGWRRPTTQELLKCQKGLDSGEVDPVLTSVSATVPNTADLDVNGDTSFDITYTYIDAEYVPTSVTLTSSTSGTATISEVAIENGFTVTVTGGVADEVITLTVNVDSVLSEEKTVTLQATVV